MHTFEEAQRQILEAISPMGEETISVRQSLGRVLAESPRVPCDFPGARMSAVDGYAVKRGPEREFREVGVVLAGDVPAFAIGPGQCAAVMTGGIVPAGADLVVRVEDTETSGSIVRIQGDLESGAFINEPGSEARAGDPFLKAGQRIARTVYPVLFYAGIARVRVFCPPRIGLLVTGAELREVEDGPKVGRVFNTNEPMLDSILHAIALCADRRLRVGEDEDETRRALDELGADCDIVITSGGVSMGRRDHLKTIFLSGDFRVLVNGTSIRPGRPLMVAERKDTVFFGMPGYPAALLTNALLYLVPALKKAQGLRDFAHRWLQARLATPMRSRLGRLDFNRAALALEDGAWVARDLPSQQTSRFLDFADANGLVMLPKEVGSLEAGAAVKALHFDLELCE